VFPPAPPALWPRLALAGGLTLAAVVALGALLLPFLPRRSRPTPESVAVASAQPAPHKPMAGRRVALPPRRQEPPDSPRPPARTAEQRPAEKPPAVPPLQPPPTPAPRPVLPPAVKPPVAAVPDLKAGDSFYQEVVVGRVSRYLVLGSSVGQNVRYALLSRFTVERMLPDGGLVVRQKVEGVRLSNADPGLQARLDALLQKTKGATFTLTLNARRQVTRFEGGGAGPAVLGGVNPLGGQTFLLWSFLDADGWKELAELSLFRPERPLRKGEKWTRPLTHSWGPLGRWAGQVGFVHVGKEAGVDRFRYALSLAYQPPRPGAGAGLPFQVGRADFRIQTADGVLAWNAGRGRVSAFEERFHVRGQLAVSCLGVVTGVNLDEAQVFQVRILEHNPWRK
jgi:hypothetical protein